MVNFTQAIKFPYLIRPGSWQLNLTISLVEWSISSLPILQSTAFSSDDIYPVYSSESPSVIYDGVKSFTWNSSIANDYPLTGRFAILSSTCAVV